MLLFSDLYLAIAEVLMTDFTVRQAWLGRYLTGVTAAVILVSHEHEFIEKACNHIAEVLLLAKFHYVSSCMENSFVC